jgi:hypothetical protein
MPLQRTALLLLILLPRALWAQSDPNCLKKVFNEYCLGGSMQQLRQRYPAGVPAQSQGERSAMIYYHGRERTFVMAYQGRIYKVLHTYEPASQIQLKDLQQRLETKYGPYRDQSHYPGYARNIASQIGAIRRGEGALKYVWQMPEQPWRIELEWTRKLGITLAYLANDLDDKQQKLVDSGL